MVFVNRPKTRLATLYRFVPEAGGSHESMFDTYTQYISVRTLDDRGATPEFIEVAGMPAIWIGIQDGAKPAEWATDFAVTTGLGLEYHEQHCGGVLLLGIDGDTYALGYGNGHRLIPDELKDQRFGLSFLIRRLDRDQVRDLVRRRANARGRTDSTVVVAGAPVWTLGVAENVEIIRRVGGRAKELKVTFSSADDRPIIVEGSIGLRMRFGVKPDALVADIRECARVCRDEQPDPALEFIEYVQPVADADTKALLDFELETLLAGSVADCGERLLPVIPTTVLEHYAAARSFTIRIGHARCGAVPSLELADILRRTRLQQAGKRVNALRCGRVSLNADNAGDDVIAEARADRWLEVNVSMGSRRFFLMDGEWFEIGADCRTRSSRSPRPRSPVRPGFLGRWASRSR